MTTYAATSHRPTSSWPLFAALGAGTALVLAAIGTFGDFTGNDTREQGMNEYLFVAGIVVVSAAVVFGLVVRTATPSNAGTRALILAGIAVPSILVFWSGLPPVLAVGAIGCALASRRADGALSAMARVAAGLSGLVLAAAVYLAFMG